MIIDQYIRAEDLQEYRRFCIHHSRAFGRELPAELCHYTDANGLIGILKTRQIWATQVTCLNDTLEQRHFGDLVHEAVKARRKQNTDPLLEPLFRIADAAGSRTRSDPGTLAICGSTTRPRCRPTAAIAASIKEWGWTTPALVGEDGGLIAGHARILAARQPGIAEILGDGRRSQERRPLEQWDAQIGRTYPGRASSTNAAESERIVYARERVPDTRARRVCVFRGVDPCLLAIFISPHLLGRKPL